MKDKKKKLDLLEQKEQKEKHTENVRKRFKEAILKKYGDLPNNQWENKTLNFKESRKLANQLREDWGEPKFLQEAFKDKFAKLDMDNNNETDLQEMITFDLESRNSFDDFVVAIYWIGYNVNMSHLKKCTKLK